MTSLLSPTSVAPATPSRMPSISSFEIFAPRLALRRALALLAVTLAAPAHAQQAGSPTVPARRPLAIIHATIHTMKDSIPIRDGTIVVDGGRIVSVGPRGTIKVPANARVIDASGKFVIPGLWDMHVHTAVPDGESLLGLYIANGVTGVRDMGGDFAIIRRWRDEIRGGTRVGPRIVASGPYVQGGDAALPHFVVRTPEQAHAAVDSLARLGVDFVKLHEMVPRDAFFALARAARARGLPLAGHLQTDVTVEEAADSGQRSLEHLDGFLNPCSAADSVRLSAAYPLDRPSSASAARATRRRSIATSPPDPTWVTPTFVALEMLAALPKERCRRTRSRTTSRRCCATRWRRRSRSRPTCLRTRACSDARSGRSGSRW